jgi:hypothetical protein
VSHRQTGKGTSAQKLFFLESHCRSFSMFVLVHNHARGGTQADRKRHISYSIPIRQSGCEGLSVKIHNRFLDSVDIKSMPTGACMDSVEIKWWSTGASIL